MKKEDKMIYLKLEEKPENIIELLEKLFSYNHIKILYEGRNPNNEYITNVKTYTNPDCNILQCDENKFRSFDDVIEIVQTYFPETDDLTILHALLTVNIKNSVGDTLLPRMLMCRGIHKPTIYYSSKFEENYNGGTFTDIEYEESKYTWKQLLNEIGITNFNELREYINKHKEKEMEVVS